MGYFHQPQTGVGLGATGIEALLEHVRMVENKADKHELAMAPSMAEMFALQSASLQRQQQVLLQEKQLVQKGGQADQLMDYVPYVLGGLGALVGLVLIIRTRRTK
jgi:hypothetical protein